ncbi:hypothetical protein JYU34_008397 [Plutella xylostella]|uniref:Uncharacterized protein n=1 Tax=Plutella xylostella TaxID=51655 RepID=A0ABQ7QN03_PLUXY|nr:hypothetical protein JYU34_008397 [Plutella xylostella]
MCVRLAANGGDVANNGLLPAEWAEVTRHRRQQTRIPRPARVSPARGVASPRQAGPGAASPGRHRPGCHQREVASARELPAPATTSYKPLTVGSIAAPPN